MSEDKPNEGEYINWVDDDGEEMIEIDEEDLEDLLGEDDEDENNVNSSFYEADDEFEIEEKNKEYFEGLDENSNLVKPNFWLLNAHSDSPVYCCAIDPKFNSLLVTGGGDDKAKIWDEENSIKNNFPIWKSKGLDDSIVSCEFSKDSAFLSVCDLSGNIEIYKINYFEEDGGQKDKKKNFKLVSFISNANTEKSDLSWCFWHFGVKNVLFSGYDNGLIYMWKINYNITEIDNNFEFKVYTPPVIQKSSSSKEADSSSSSSKSSSSNKSECALLLTGSTLASGYVNGSVIIFDLKNISVLYNIMTQSSNPELNAILSMDFNNNLLACGNLNGNVFVFNTNNGKQIKELTCSSSVSSSTNNENNESVESLKFYTNSKKESEKGKEILLLACGTINGLIYIWDIQHNFGERVKIRLESGICKIIWNPNLPILYTGGLDGIIRIIDAQTCKMEKELGRHQDEILDICISSDAKKLISCCEDGSVFIFSI